MPVADKPGDAKLAVWQISVGYILDEAGIHRYESEVADVAIILLF
jgi:hypothetical protein